MFFQFLRCALRRFLNKSTQPAIGMDASARLFGEKKAPKSLADASIPMAGRLKQGQSLAVTAKEGQPSARIADKYTRLA